MFMLLVRVEVRAEHLASFTRAIEANARLSVAEDPGCLRFDVAQEVEHPARWVFVECYTGEAAWEAHRRSAHFEAYKQVADQALVSREVIRLRPLEVAAAS